MKNVILANNTGDNCSYPGAGYEFTDDGGNLSDDDTCGFSAATSHSNIDPLLGHASATTAAAPRPIPLLPGSPAIDAGVSATCAAAVGDPTYGAGGKDQRGVTRPSACDIGAFESQGFTLGSLTGTPQSAIVNTAFANSLGLTVTSSYAEPVDGGVVTFTPPASGASTNPAIHTATIASELVSQSVSANSTVGGPYNVTASANGASSVNFSLTNNSAADTTAPLVTAFTATTPANSFNIPITDFEASDAVGVTGFLITQTSTPPSAGDLGWAGTAPTTYTVLSDGTYTLYPWARDAADNVSDVFTSPATVEVDTTPPSVTVNQAAGQADPTGISPINFTAAFSESITGFEGSEVSFTGSTASGTLSASISGTGPSYTLSVTGMTGSGSVVVSVPAGAVVDMAGNSSAASTSTDNSVAYVTAPAAYSKSAPANAATNQPTNPTLSWGSSSGATSYEYCYATTTGCTNWTSVGTNTSVGLSGLSNNQTYYWQVRAVNAGGTTLANTGTYWSFTTIVAAPGAFNKTSPANSATGVATNPTLSWGTSSGASFVRILLRHHHRLHQLDLGRDEHLGRPVRAEQQPDLLLAGARRQCRRNHAGQHRHLLVLHHHRGRSRRLQQDQPGKQCHRRGDQPDAFLGYEQRRDFV